MGLPTVSYHSAKFGGHRYNGGADISFFINHVSHDQKFMWLWTWGFATASYHSGKFGGHRYCRRPDTIVYICHVTTWLKSHVN